MPARRSRTVNWLDSLHRICERGGPIEITVDLPAPTDGSAASPNVIWRVRVLEVSDDGGIVVEQPTALGAAMELYEGTRLIGIMTVGQNRWMFRTRVCERTEHRLSSRASMPACRLELPETVERCQRRNFYRMSTVQLALPAVHCGKVIDIDESRVVESALRSEIERMLDSQIIARLDPAARAPLMPAVSDTCHGQLVNIGGGGVGMVVLPEDHLMLDGKRALWLSIDLRPQVPAPFGVLARVRHVHSESSGAIYAGMSFDFAPDGRHEKFISGLLCRFSAETQKQQARTTSAAEG